jgi:hypothetical protein
MKYSGQAGSTTAIFAKKRKKKAIFSGWLQKKAVSFD